MQGRKPADRSDYCDATYPYVDGIERLVVDDCKAGVARDATVDYATYVGGAVGESSAATAAAFGARTDDLLVGGAMAALNVAAGAAAVGAGAHAGVVAKVLRYRPREVPSADGQRRAGKDASVTAQLWGAAALSGRVRAAQDGRWASKDSAAVLDMASFAHGSAAAGNAAEALAVWTIGAGLRTVDAATGALLWDAATATGEAELASCGAADPTKSQQQQQQQQREMHAGHRPPSTGGDFCGATEKLGARFADEATDFARTGATAETLGAYYEDSCRVSHTPPSPAGLNAAAAAAATDAGPTAQAASLLGHDVLTVVKRAVVYVLKAADGTLLHKLDMAADDHAPAFVCHDPPGATTEAQCAQGGGEGGNGSFGGLPGGLPPIVTDATVSADDALLLVSGFKLVQERTTDCLALKSCRVSQVGFLRAFDLRRGAGGGRGGAAASPKTYALKWSTFDFGSRGVFPSDYADSALRRVVRGDNGQVYVLGETRGAPLSILRFDGKTSTSLQALSATCGARGGGGGGGDTATAAEWVAERLGGANSSTLRSTGARCGQYAPPRFRHANGNVFAEPSFVPSKSRQLPDGRTHTYYCNWQGWYVVRPPRTLLLTSAFSFLY